MTGPRDTLLAAHAAYRRRSWAEAGDGFRAAREEGPLAAEDVAALAECAWWQGAIEECLAADEEAYRLFLDDDPPATRRAAMLAMELGFFWSLRGETSIGSGWLSRAQRLLDGVPECVEHGYLLHLQIEETIGRGDLDRAMTLAREAGAIAEHHRDETLAALALAAEGIVTVRQGRVTAGMGLLDEAMLPVLAGRVEPMFAGFVYCELMAVCHELADIERARQWTEATGRWAAGFSDAVMFLGVCRVHRAQVLQVQGDWVRAEEEARRVCEDLATVNVVAVGHAQYELGEVRRRRGDLAGAEAAYARAHELGRDPQPGLALLRLARGDAAGALEAVRAGAGASDTDPLALATLWAAEVEIAVAAGDLDGARRASRELDRVAEAYGSSGLLVAAAEARGTVHLAGGDPGRALAHLREACRRWQELEAPYPVARVRELLGRAHRALGNEEGSALELDAAAAAFARLGATVDAGRVGALRAVPPGPEEPGTPELREPPEPPEAPDGLTAREVEVLVLVAGGSTNRDVAEALFLSEKTVARHLSNIFTKLDVSSRTGAAAHAFARGLVPAPRR